MATRKDPAGSPLPPSAAQQSLPFEQKPIREVLTIQEGSLGPVKPCEIEVGPLTVLIGQQGTGKSLIAQILYFFRALPDLVQYTLATNTDGQGSPESLLRGIINGLRSRDRSFASLTRPNLVLTWEGSLSLEGDDSTLHELGFNAQYSSRQVNFRTGVVRLAESIASTQGARLFPTAAIFVPTERLFYSQFINPFAQRMLRTPLILERYASWMSVAGATLSRWEEGETSTKEGQWIKERLARALSGEVRMVANQWKWEFHDGKDTSRIDLDMASSGQRANWSLSLLPQALLWWRLHSDSLTPIANPFTLYIEEPEIHLHPAAENAVIEVIAFLINQGFRVVLTTHSLTVLYTINNLLAASKLPRGRQEDGLPPPEIRLRPEQVMAYHLEQGGTVTSLLDPETGAIDESKLGKVSDTLSAQMNRILVLSEG